MTPDTLLSQLSAVPTARFTANVTRVSPTYIEADGPLCTVGDLCEVETRSENSCMAEVVKVDTHRTVLIPLSQNAPIFPDAKLTLLPANNQAKVGDSFSGRMVDAMGKPIDEKGPVRSTQKLPLQGTVTSPLNRQDPKTGLETGIKAIDGLLSLGKGQRVGVFAAGGVGKTTLLGQLSRQVDCDRCILCLTGERGREVQSLWEEIAVSGDVDKYTCVAATSDVSAALRVRAVYQALTLAEYWRSEGEHVLLLIDSVTRFAMALREIGLAAGEPPTLRAYTPNVFDTLPKVVERCGAVKSGGAITAIMTVLSETDDVDDPITEVMKSLLDGHFILSRRLAEQGQFPAIDVSKSVSRLSENIMSEEHSDHAQKTLVMLSTYEDSRIMIESGVYKRGSDPAIDRAVSQKEKLSAFLKQSFSVSVPLSETKAKLSAIVNGSHYG